MTTSYRISNLFLMVAALGLLFVSGCANFLQPETGAVARQEARISLATHGVTEGIFSTGDIDLAYSLSPTGDALQLTGALEFDRSLTDSFRSVNRFWLKMSFLDRDGRVLQTVDITPVIGYRYSYDQAMDVHGLYRKPMGATAIAFNYFGQFRDEAERLRGSEWSIYYFPYE